MDQSEVAVTGSTETNGNGADAPRSCADTPCGLRARIAELEGQIGRWDESFSTLPDAWILADSDVRVTRFNAAAEQLFGIPAINVVSHQPHLLGLLHDAIVNEPEGIFRGIRVALAEQGFVKSLRVQIRSTAGAVTPCLLSAHAVGGLTAPGGYSVVIHDNSETEKLVITDDGSGLYNKRHLAAALSREEHRAHRYEQPLSVLFVDVDGLKALNNRHGHLCADAMLRAVADTIGQTIRVKIDTACRFGGDEIVVILPVTDACGAKQAAERIRSAVESIDVAAAVASRVRISDCQRRALEQSSVTVTVGCATAELVLPGAIDLLQEANSAMMEQKKHDRRNTVLHFIDITSLRPAAP
jgi:diguanylate cyclase (GGDEF)-like protein